MLGSCVWREKLEDKKYTAQIRYHGTLMECFLEQKNDNQTQITFTQPDFSLAQGQSVVVYDENVCIGGGIVT
jgi:tRNA-specific 2-thiouridylase